MNMERNTKCSKWKTFIVVILSDMMALKSLEQQTRLKVNIEILSHTLTYCYPHLPESDLS